MYTKLLALFCTGAVAALMTSAPLAAEDAHHGHGAPANHPGWQPLAH